ncbi:hypothetical protein AAL_02138 [Moelleriella libera RCEF 2490]|uniref:Uncharacterized protein n=1 Tax=Moelleriella libera RCEF 2490 TaxID=1081109 RepID=A0A168F7H8_9HYPO|nr:hypothetical protein AAL_02138 [Moelleriella libera RCEF 2490]
MAPPNNVKTLDDCKGDKFKGKGHRVGSITQEEEKREIPSDPEVDSSKAPVRTMAGSTTHEKREDSQGGQSSQEATYTVRGQDHSEQATTQYGDEHQGEAPEQNEAGPRYAITEGKHRGSAKTIYGRTYGSQKPG